MPGRFYTAPLDAITVTTDADQDIIEMVASATVPFKVHAISLTSTTTTDERARLRLLRRSTTGSGGSALTESPKDAENTVTASTAVSAIVTTPGTIGVILNAWQWNQQGEFLYLPTPEMQVEAASAGRVCLNLQSALGGSRVWSGYVVWEE